MNKLFFTFAIFLFLGISICYADASTEQAPPIIATYCLLNSFGTNINNSPQFDYLIKNAPFDKINRLYIAFADIQDNGVFGFKGDSASYKAYFLTNLVAKYKSMNPKGKVLISAGTNTEIEVGYVTGEKGKEVAKNIVTFLKKYKLDGFDWDHEECIGSETLTFLQDIRNAYTNAGTNYLLTLPVWQFSEFASYGDIPEIVKAVDQINIMSYGIDDPLLNSIDDWNSEGVPYAKMVGGIEVEITYKGWGGTDSLGENGTIYQKCATAQKYNIAGMFSWRIDYDYNPDTSPKSYPTFKGSLDMYNYMQKDKISDQWLVVSE